jgi:hypothetical protein
MNIEDIKTYISERLHVLNLNMNSEIDEQDREKPADYLKVGKIEGGINELMRLATAINRSEKSA